MLLSASDSSLVHLGVSNTQGAFELKNISLAHYLLKITFVRYQPHSENIRPPTSGSVVNLGTLKMHVARTTLDEVVIAEKIPVVVKQDTIEFNANSFKINKNANVEDLL